MSTAASLRSGPGIVDTGFHIPHLRLDRAEISRFHGWSQGLGSVALAGTRAFAGSDEDTLTLAVDAVRRARTSARRLGTDVRPDALYFASTTAPFADRSNAGLIAVASGIGSQTAVADFAGTLRAGTSALMAACERAALGRFSVAVGADMRRARAASQAEQAFGDAAAAIVTGDRGVIATLLGTSTESFDLVDHYRQQGEPVDYVWEDRWLRDVGYLGEVTRVVSAFLQSAGVKADEIDHLCLPVGSLRVAASLGSAIGAPASALSTQVLSTVGDTGTAAPLLQLVEALSRAEPRQRILVIGFGQGVDVLLFEVTDEITAWRRNSELSRDPGFVTSYARYLTLREMIDIDLGMRAEADKGTAMPAAFRHRDFLNRLVGGRCTKCDTYQLPAHVTCVNPGCRANGPQEPYSFADSHARIISFTEDRLTFTVDPPARFGMVEFDEGARFMMDLADVDGRQLEVGTRVRMAFRIKDKDRIRAFRRYFWKAVPLDSEGVR